MVSAGCVGRPPLEKSLDDKPRPKTAPLSDMEVQDVLHRMAFELEPLTGQTTRGDTALKASHRCLMLFMAALIAANETPSPAKPTRDRQ